jgi:hypothetical protein
MAKKALAVLLCVLFIGLRPALADEELACESEDADEAVTEFLEDLEEAIDDMETYRCRMISENWKGDRYEFKVSRVSFKKPDLLRLDVLEGHKRGSSVLLDKDGKIRGMNSWGFRSTLRPTDRRLMNIRGQTFLNSSMHDKLRRLKEAIFVKGFGAELKEGEWEERPAYILMIEHNEPGSPLTREDIWFDRETYFLLKDIRYEGGSIVSDVTWKDIEINIHLEEDLFEF